MVIRPGLGNEGAPQRAGLLVVAPIDEGQGPRGDLAVRFPPYARPDRAPVGQGAVLQQVVERRERVAPVREVPVSASPEWCSGDLESTGRAGDAAGAFRRHWRPATMAPCPSHRVLLGGKA
jgi:hypothetical protein